MKTKIYPITGMTCASCAARLEKAVSINGGVVSASVNFANETLTVESDEQMFPEERLLAVVHAAGFELVVVNEEDEEEAVEQMHSRRLKNLRWRTIAAIILATPIAVIGMFFHDMPYAGYIMWILSTPVVFWLGKEFFVNAWKQLKLRTANMDTLVALSISVAYLFSLFNLFFPKFWISRGLEPHLYFEASAVIVAFILIGRLLEEKAKSSTSAAIRELIGMQPKTATVLRDGEHTEVPIARIQIGNRVVVKPGEQIAVDGEVVEGNSFVDESMLSGEAIPVAKTQGDKLYAGTINQHGSLLFTAERVGKQTLLSQIIRSVKEAQGSKAPVQKIVDQVAAIFVPIVIWVAVAAFTVWAIYGGSNALTHAILAFVTVMVIACPCALGLATPTAIMVGVGKAARNGILIKDAESLESAHKVTTVVLDKTGTITVGEPQVTDLVWREGADKASLRTLSAIEQLSEHPLAGAVVEYIAEQEIQSGTQTMPAAVDFGSIKPSVVKKNASAKTFSLPSATLTQGTIVQNFESLTGKGVTAEVAGKRYYVGNRKLVEEHELKIDSVLIDAANEMERQAKTVIWFADTTEVLVVMALADAVKPTSKEAVSHLEYSGIDVHMLTGDGNSTATAIAQEVGITHFRAEMLPQDKADYIKELQSQGKVVAMIGDGINDSTALAQADISIAMGAGSDIAMKVAKMTIISSDLAKIPLAIKISKQTVRTIRQNLFWAFIYNLIAIPVAAGVLYPINGFLLNPMIAGAAMALSSVSVMLNSLRLKWKRN